MLKIEVKRGDAVVRYFNVKQDGDPVDISDWFFRLTVKEDLSDPYEDAVIAKERTPPHDEPSEGKSSITIKGEETDIEPGAYHFDIQIGVPVETEDGDEGPEYHKRSKKGIFEVVPTPSQDA